jgi:hypothetical protein
MQKQKKKDAGQQEKNICEYLFFGVSSKLHLPPTSYSLLNLPLSVGVLSCFRS